MQQQQQQQRQQENHRYCLIDLWVEKTIYHLIIMKMNERSTVFVWNNGSNYDI